MVVVKVAAVRAWTPGAKWHLVREQYRLDLAVSMCGIGNGESWYVRTDENDGKMCNVCLHAVLVARGEI
jgi:hypothetical protein